LPGKEVFSSFPDGKIAEFAASDALIDCPFGFADTSRKSIVQGFGLVHSKTSHLNKTKTALKD
jgi:hypothetical protein